MKNLSYCWSRFVFRSCVPVLLVLSVMAGPLAQADRLYFSDGETLSGTFTGIADGKVSWSSPILGDFVIEQFHVNLIESGDHFDIKTSGQNLSNCWMYVQSEKQHLHCAEGVKTISSWKLVVAAGETLTEPLPILAQKGEIKVAAEDSTGNNEISKYNVNARSEWRYIESRHTFALVVQEESAESQTTRNMWRGSYQYDQFFTDQWFATGNAFYEEDEFRDIDQRTSAGLGMGYQFLETSYLNLLGKGTVNYVDEQFSTGVKRTRPAFLWNLNFAWKFNDAGMEFFHRHAVLQSFKSAGDYEINSLTGLKYPINGHFSSVVQLQLDYDNLPADDNIEKEDRKWSIGIDYNW
jgi:putative salt-induced outer membrane protein YdiY